MPIFHYTGSYEKFKFLLPHCSTKGYNDICWFVCGRIKEKIDTIAICHKTSSVYCIANTAQWSTNTVLLSRLTIVSREAKKKQAVRDEQMSYLHVAPL